METVVELQNVNKIYRIDKRELPVLKNIDIRIEKGERLAIMGPSGSGKSTLLHLIGCLDRPSSGKILIDGTDISKLTDDDLARIRSGKIGFVFQFFYLIPTMTALDNVMLPMTFSRIPGSQRKERAEELLKSVGLGDRMYHKRSELSGGEVQRVAIARAMANNPQIILADEPTGNLDSESGKEIMGLLMKLNEEQKITLVIITHEKSIASYAQKVINLKDGELLGG